MNQDQIIVTVVSPLKTYFQGVALAVSSVNSAGPFDIIHSHANFISIVENQPIKVTIISPTNSTQTEQMTFNFTQAIIHNFENRVVVYAEPLSAEDIFRHT